MAIAKMNRFTLLTFHAHKRELLKQLQVFGDVHLKSPDKEALDALPFLRSDFSQDALSSLEVELEKVRFATEKIRPYVDKPGLTAKRPSLSFEAFDHYLLDYDYESVYQKVKQQDEKIAGLKAEAARRAAENETMQSWKSLDVPPAEMDSLSETGYLLGTVNKQSADDFLEKIAAAFDTVYVEHLDTVKDDTTLLMLFPASLYEDLYVFSREQGFTKAAIAFRDVPEKVIEENLRSIQDLQEQQKAAVEVISTAKIEYEKLQIVLDYFVTVLERENATRNFLASDTTILIEGWVPADESEALHKIVQSVCGQEYFLEETEVEHSSLDVPIKLKNNAFVGAFESITSMYAVPFYKEIDPTPLLAPFYWLFFGMMVGDLGYGIVIFIGTTLALKFIDFKEGMRNFIRFFRYLSTSVMLMGAVYGGVFGVTIIKPLPLIENGVQVGTKAILDSQLDITLMLIISIAIGVVHITVGLLSKLYVSFRDKDYAAGICDGLLWMGALFGGIAWLLGVMGIAPAVETVGFWVFCISMVGLVLTQGRDSPSIGGKIGNGLFGAYGITSYVGDVVSYTRIVALALSGAYIAYAFNLMSGLIVGEFGAGNIVVGIIRLIFGIIVVVFGQTLNLGLAMLGGYVHSCRLQYVEFFGKFYEGGGVPFQPLTLKSDHIHITK